MHAITPFTTQKTLQGTYTTTSHLPASPCSPMRTKKSTPVRRRRRIEPLRLPRTARVEFCGWRPNTTTTARATPSVRARTGRVWAVYTLPATGQVGTVWGDLATPATRLRHSVLNRGMPLTDDDIQALVAKKTAMGYRCERVSLRTFSTKLRRAFECTFAEDDVAVTLAVYNLDYDTEATYEAVRRARGHTQRRALAARPCTGQSGTHGFAETFFVARDRAQQLIADYCRYWHGQRIAGLRVNVVDSPQPFPVDSPTPRIVPAFQSTRRTPTVHIGVIDVLSLE